MKLKTSLVRCHSKKTHSRVLNSGVIAECGGFLHKRIEFGNWILACPAYYTLFNVALNSCVSVSSGSEPSE